MFLIENVKKMMGWCPNTTAMNAEKVGKFNDFGLNESDKGRESNHKTMKWGNKYHNLILIVSILGTLGPINIIISWGGMNTGVLLAGAFLGIMISMVMQKSILHSLNRIKVRTPPKTTPQISIKKASIFGIGFLLYMLVLIQFIPIVGLLTLAAFHSGFGMSVLWSIYGQITQWERKNETMLIVPGFATPVIAVSYGRK